MIALQQHPEPWLPPEEYAKAVGQLRLQLASVFKFVNEGVHYGLKAHVPGAIEEIVSLCEDFGLRVRGVDKPIDHDRVRTKIINGRGRKRAGGTS